MLPERQTLSYEDGQVKLREGHQTFKNLECAGLTALSLPRSRWLIRRAVKKAAPAKVE